LRAADARARTPAAGNRRTPCLCSRIVRILEFGRAENEPCGGEHDVFIDIAERDERIVQAVLLKYIGDAQEFRGRDGKGDFRPRRGETKCLAPAGAAMQHERPIAREIDRGIGSIEHHAPFAGAQNLRERLDAGQGIQKTGLRVGRGIARQFLQILNAYDGRFAIGIDDFEFSVTAGSGFCGHLAQPRVGLPDLFLMFRMANVHEREETRDVLLGSRVTNGIENLRPARMEQAFDLGKALLEIVVRERCGRAVIQSFLGREILRASPEARASIFDRIDPHLAVGLTPLPEIKLWHVVVILGFAVGWQWHRSLASGGGARVI